MPGKISETSIAAVRDRVDIVDLVSEYVTLKKAGMRHTGLCPFHNEKTPSFSVDRDKGLYYCFGCSKGGDSIDFLMEVERLDFSEAIEKLADRYGIELEREAGRSGDEPGLRRLRELNELAAKYYVYVLKETESGKSCLDYLKERGISDDSVQEFRLGFAPPGWTHLTELARKKGFQDRELLEAGLSLRGDRGLYDTFVDRLIFPIADVADRPIAFGGRLLGSGQPKYKNSPESRVYSKRNHLYALNLARKAIKEEGMAVVCEGYTDVIWLHQVGVRNAVAPLGTALTERQLQLLHKQTDNVVLLFDGDSAGEAAAGRGLELAQSTGLRIRVAALPPGEDPADFARERGGETVRELLTAALPVVEFRLRGALAGLDPADPESVEEALNAGAEILAGISSPISAEHYTHWLAGELSLSERSAAYLNERIAEQRRRAGRDAAVRVRETAGTEGGTADAAVAVLEEGLLGALLDLGFPTGWEDGLLKREDFLDAEMAEAYLALAAGKSPDEVLTEADAEGARRLKGLIMAAAGAGAEALPIALRLKELSLKRQEAAMIKEIESSADTDKLKVLTRLSQDRKAVRRRISDHIEFVTHEED